MNKTSEFYMIFARKKILFPEVCGIIPGSKAEIEQTQPQHQLRDHSGRRSTGALVLHKLFVHLRTVLCSMYRPVTL